MNYREMMQNAPKGAVTVFSLEAERKKQRKALAEQLGKKVEDLTPEELEKANQLNAIPDIDMMIP